MNRCFSRMVIKATFGSFLFFMSSNCWATTYYLNASAGMDSNNGTSSSTPWKSIAKVNASTFLPGDKILFSAGETWREMLYVPSSGTAGKPITFGSYGSGYKPVISGANVINPGASWSISSAANTWQTTGISLEPKVVAMNGRMGRKKGSLSKLKGEYDWYWNAGVLTIWSAADPDTAYTWPGVEIGQRNTCLTWNAKNYLSFQNIDFVAANRYNIFIDGISSNILFDSCGLYKAYQHGINHSSLFASSYVTLRNCTVAYNGGVGILANGNTDHWTIQGNTVYNNGYTNEPGGVENTWGAGIKMVGTRGGATCKNHLVENNEVYYTGYLDNGTTRVINVPNKGFGIWADLVDSGNVAANGNIVRNNHVHHNADSGLFIEKSRYCSYYYNISYGNGQYGLRMDADENGPVVQDNYVYNNVFYGNIVGLYVAGGWSDNGIYVRDNIFMNNISVGNSSRQLLTRWGGDNDVLRGSGNIYGFNAFGPEQANFIEWGQNELKSSYASWNNSYGSDTHSVSSDPLLRDPAIADFTLQPASPCLDAGTDVGITVDYNGNPVPYNNRVDVGAFEK
ncbi:MAG: right-handed parallel beta-helix repeat-containing protein [Verrucomicrobia bacterium]|nr:right-handed parallel beta-helix repeat-containing protein [Deltaproteobacteria bacterium]